MTWLLIVPTVIVLALVLWLAVLPIGTGIKGEIGPEGAEHHVEGRVVGGSPFAKLVRRLRGKDGDDPASGIMVALRAHFAGDDAGPYLICHELGHIIRAMAMGWVRYLWRYITDPKFRSAEEAWCHQFALDNQSDGLIRLLFQRMAAAELNRTGTVTPVAG